MNDDLILSEEQEEVVYRSIDNQLNIESVDATKKNNKNLILQIKNKKNKINIKYNKKGVK